MRRALLIGINIYDTGNNLQGCVNDVNNIRALLLSNGYRPQDILMLTDRQATGRRVHEALGDLITSAKPGDHWTWWHSSHGSRIQDIHGDEASGQDSILCCSDMDWDNPRSYLLDDDIAKLIALQAPGVTGTIGADACHSGTVNREFNDVLRFLPPPFAVAGRTRPLFPSLRQAIPDNGLEPILLPDQPGLVFLSGCLDDQTSADADLGPYAEGGRYQGAFTAAFLAASRRVGLTNTQLAWEYARSWLASNQYAQVPQLSADPQRLTAPVFGA